MKATYSNLVNSKFFNPAFNSAIFDGPLRIYFAQFHEALALKIYFGIQQMDPQFLDHLKASAKSVSGNLLVMLYPSSEAFSLSIDSDSETWAVDHLYEDGVLAIRGPFEDNKLLEVVKGIIDLGQSRMMAAPAGLEAENLAAL